MRLHAAANHFNNMPCVDAYTGQQAFYAQLALYDDTKRDSEVGERRVFSVAPGTVIPSRRVVQAAGSRWIIGHGNPDTYRGKLIRTGYVAHEATELATIRTLGQACTNAAGRTAWAGDAWIKNLADNEHSSALVPQFHIHFASSEAVPAQSLVTYGGRLLVVRTPHRGPGGTLIALCDETPTIEVATITTGTRDPVTGVTSAGTASATAVRMRWQSLFEYQNHLAPKFSAGDAQLAFAKAQPIKPGTVVTLSDGTWLIQSALDEGDVWLCRATRQ